MRVFISYGHPPPENAALVQRIRARLDAAGHETWIDTGGIEHGDDWRRAIMAGLQNSDWTLAFLSRHSVRDPGVCLDELNIALHVKGGAIAAVLIEPEHQVDPPHHLGGSQRIDMADWRMRAATGGAAWEAWFDARLAEIEAVLASPVAQRFAAEIDLLDRLLRPVEQAADIPPLLDGFVGRGWLLDELDRRRRGALPHRLIWIAGGPGTGKSAFAAWLATYHRANVIALNLCDALLDARNQPARVLHTLAFQLARRIPDYRAHLLTRLARLANRPGRDPLAELSEPMEAGLVQAALETKRMPPEEKFHWLLAEPLNHCIDGGRGTDRYLLVLDGLDETLRDGESELAELFTGRAAKLPGWLAVAATSRPELAHILSQVEPLHLDAAAGQRQDLHVYAQAWFGPGDPALLDRVVEAAEGSFLYLRFLREAVEAGWMSLHAPEGLPRGMIGMYRRWFRRQFPDRAAYRRDVVPLLSVLCAARLAVPLDLLRAIRALGWDDLHRRTRMLEALGSLFVRRGDALAPCHASLRDWLTDPDAAHAAFVVDPAPGSRLLADALWPRFVALLDTPAGTLPDAFTLAELPRLGMQQGDAVLRGYLDAAGEWRPVAAQLHDIVTIMQQKVSWRAALDWLRLYDVLAERSGAEALADRRWALVESGDIQRTIGQTAAALQAYRQSKLVAESLLAAAPGNLDRQHELSVSHDRIGDVLVAQGELAQALDAFQAGMHIRRKLVDQDPGNAGWQRDLSVSQDRIGDVLVAQGELAQALDAFQAGMHIRRKLVDQDPGNAGWQRDLSISHERIGDVLAAQGELAQALDAFQAGMHIRRKLVDQDPGNAGWQRDLSVSHERIGNVLVAQGELAQALDAFQAGMHIRRKLVDQDPGNAGWQRDVLGSLYKLAEVAASAADWPQAKAQAAQALALARDLVTRFPNNPQHTRDLPVVESLHRRIEAQAA